MAWRTKHAAYVCRGSSGPSGQALHACMGAQAPRRALRPAVPPARQGSVHPAGTDLSLVSGKEMPNSGSRLNHSHTVSRVKVPLEGKFVRRRTGPGSAPAVLSSALPPPRPRWASAAAKPPPGLGSGQNSQLAIGYFARPDRIEPSSTVRVQHEIALHAAAKAGAVAGATEHPPPGGPRRSP